MTKLEQVARAIHASDFEDGSIPWEHINPGGQSDYRKYARAAVEALKDATPAMCEAGQETGVAGYEMFVQDKHMQIIWQDMIDAILSEKAG